VSSLPSPHKSSAPGLTIAGRANSAAHARSPEEIRIDAPDHRALR
jgi:hypothetical protein